MFLPFQVQVEHLFLTLVLFKSRGTRVLYTNQTWKTHLFYWRL